MPEDPRRQITERDRAATPVDEQRSEQFKVEHIKKKFSDFGLKI
jgi:hypothetical protein